LIAQYGRGMAYTTLQPPPTGAQAYNINDSFTTEAVGTINSPRPPANHHLDLQVARPFDLRRGALRAHLALVDLLGARNITAVYRTTGLPDEDGFLLTPQGQSWLSDRPDVDAAEFNYRSFIGGPVAGLGGGNSSSSAPFFYGAPRQVRLGVQIDF